MAKYVPLGCVATVGSALRRVESLLPRFHDLLHVSGDRRSRHVASVPAGQQLVVARVNVPQVSAHREVDGIRIEPLRR